MEKISSYYFWKWADNDLRCHPREAHAALLSGWMHPALQLFDARPLLKKLEALAGRKRWRGEQWFWEVADEGSLTQTRFVFVTATSQNVFEDVVDKHLAWLGLSGIDEASGYVIRGLCPKRNCFISGQSSERFYDIEAKDLPYLIRCLDARDENPFGILDGTQIGHFVQCLAHGRRYVVEWAQHQCFPRKKPVYNLWRAQDAPRLAAMGGSYDGRPLEDDRMAPDLMRYTDTLRIFETFLRGDPRPSRYSWRNVSSLIK